MKKKDIKFLLAILLIVIFYIGDGWIYIEKTYIYPFHYREIIEDNSHRYNIEQSLILAVIRNESGFKQDAVSDSGAIGLMQIMPETAEWIDVERKVNFTKDKLYKADNNIAYGVWYLSFLRNEFNGNDILTLAAYNAGISKVHAWMEKYKWSNNFSNLEKIPYPETRHYIDKVLADKKHYQDLYGLY